jgi:hypothetical protein
MPKRPYDDQDDGEPPQPELRRPTRRSVTTASTARSSIAPSDSVSSPPTKLRRSTRRSVTTVAGPSTAPSDLGKIREKSLSVENLVEVAKMAKNQDRAELMILWLMKEYSFDFPRLKELLSGKLDTPESLV